MLAFFLLIALILLSVIYGVSIYNRLVALKNRYMNAFSQIEVQLVRRHDLIPNLVETARGYLKHERETLEAVIKARNNASQMLSEAKANLSSTSLQTIAEAEKSLTGALGKFNMVLEAYPELKANDNMIKLHEEIASTENRISFARQAYNDSAASYNAYRQFFPQKLFADSFGHTRNAELLQFEETAIYTAPKVSF